MVTPQGIVERATRSVRENRIVKGVGVRAAHTGKTLLDHGRALIRDPRTELMDSTVFQKRHPRLASMMVDRYRSRGRLQEIKDRNRVHIRRHLRKQHLDLVSYPKLLHVEMSTHCNLRCRMCSIVRPGRTRKIQHIDLAVMERLRPALPYVTDTKMHGGGEPFLNPEIRQIIRIFQENEVRLNTVTNATVIDEELAHLIGRNYSTLTVSLDGATAEVYELVRERASFSRVMHSLDLLNRHRHPEFKLILGFVIMRCNAHQLPSMVRLAREKGAQESQAAWVVPFPDLPWSQEQDPTREPERMNDLLDETYAVAEELGIGIQLPPHLPVATTRARRALDQHKPCYHQLHPTDRVEGSCRLMYDRAMILVDGTVKPCGQSQSVHDLGNVLEESFAEIWSGAGYQRLRRTFNAGTLPVTCRSCNFIRSGQLGNAKLMVEDGEGGSEALMALDRPR